MTLFLTGLLIGFSIAAPVGPIGLLCLQRSLNAGRLAGFVTGLGAATADAVFGAVAALGLGIVTSMLVGQMAWLRLGGGLFLVFLGISTLRAPVSPVGSEPTSAPPVSRAFVSTFVLTLTNPLTILSFVGIFAGLGFDPRSNGFGPAALLVVGVFLGSAAWWLFLSTAAGWLRSRTQAGGRRVVNRLAGAAIAGLGAWQLALLLR